MPDERRPLVEHQIQKNVRAIEKIESEAQSGRTGSEVVSDAIAKFCGSIRFVYFHVVWFVIWVGWNATPLTPRALKFDPVPFGILTLVVSLEAIFLSTFILISQNRQEEIAQKRERLDLQITMLAEQEDTRLLRIVRQIAEQMGIDCTDEDEGDLEAATDPQEVVRNIERMAEEGRKRDQQSPQ